jgi:hypothetical protein
MTKRFSKRYRESEVLFQEIGGRWYIFTEQNGELIYSVMPQGMDPRKTKLELYDVIEKHIDNVKSNTVNDKALI